MSVRASAGRCLVQECRGQTAWWPSKLHGYRRRDMSNEQKAAPSNELARILDSAKRLGVEMDEEEALQWLTSMAACQGDHDIAVDAASGVFGHNVTMLDFSPQQLEHFRQIGTAGGVRGRARRGGDRAGALRLGGAVQDPDLPGDCDYFERVNILAPTRDRGLPDPVAESCARRPWPP